MRLYSHKHRPFHLGPLAVERLARTKGKISETPGGSSSWTIPQPSDTSVACADSIAAVFPEYFSVFTQFLSGPVAPAKAPVPDDALVRANNLKASAYFLDATIGGCCALGPEDRAPVGHTHAFVFLIEFGREPQPGEPGDVWIRGTNAARTDLRCAEMPEQLATHVTSEIARWGKVVKEANIRIE